MSARKFLFEALLTCQTTEELERFIVDLLSEEEIARAEDRWVIAHMHLRDPVKYSLSELKRQGYGSSDKLGRILRSAKKEGSGYRLATERLKLTQQPAPEQAP